MIAYCLNYKGHTVYSDGRVYKAGELIGQYKTEAAAKAAATRNQKAMLQESNNRHHAAIARIWGR